MHRLVLLFFLAMPIGDPLLFLLFRFVAAVFDAQAEFFFFLALVLGAQGLAVASHQPAVRRPFEQSHIVGIALTDPDRIPVARAQFLVLDIGVIAGNRGRRGILRERAPNDFSGILGGQQGRETKQ